MDARQEMIKKVARILADNGGSYDSEEYAKATILVDQGIRSKEGFEIGTEYKEHTGEANNWWTAKHIIEPINYKQEEKE